MQIVIDIDEELYNYMQSKLYDEHIDRRFDYQIRFAVKDGTPLPKGHGRLGDLSKIYVELNEAQIEGTEEYKGLGEAKQMICEAPTIIEADKAESEVEK